MKTYINKEVGRVFVLTLAEMKELRDWARRGLGRNIMWLSVRGKDKQRRACLIRIAGRLTAYLKKVGQ